MLLKNNKIQIGIAFMLGVIVLLLPRPEGTRFEIAGDKDRLFFQHISDHFKLVSVKQKSDLKYTVEAINPGSKESTADYLQKKANEMKMKGVEVGYVNGLSPKAKRFLAVLAVLLFLFIVEPIPLEITAVCIAVFLVLMRVGDVKEAWAPYMHPVVIFIMCCLIFAIALDKAGLTKRMGFFIIKKAGNSIVRFTFIISIGLGLSSAFIHDAAAAAIGIVTILPLMRSVGIEPYSNTAKFMILSLAFACSCGGMGTLIGGGRCMVSAAFLKEFTGIEISFFEWIKYAMPAALLTVPAAVAVVYFVFRPDPKFRLPEIKEDIGPWSPLEKKTLIIIAVSFILWLTKGMHGMDYSVTGMLGVGALVISGALKWEDIHTNLAWGTVLFIFGGGISLGLAMGYSGAANYFANLFFPIVQGCGWLVLFIGVGIFGALVTNAMANVAAAALILPIVIPMAQLEGVDPRVMALCLGTATSFAMLLVIGCPPNAIAYSYRYFKASDLMKAGAVATPILLAILILVAAVWWKILGLV
ncbi:MAG: DASS family sodium-coupled anion symporter [Deltaproteobacteria bacterium]|nr:DASS family sodium-coupled anion symporter [Deltaproteobacteria bacterium]